MTSAFSPRSSLKNKKSPVLSFYRTQSICSLHLGLHASKYQDQFKPNESLETAHLALCLQPTAENKDAQLYYLLFIKKKKKETGQNEAWWSVVWSQKQLHWYQDQCAVSEPLVTSQGADFSESLKMRQNGYQKKMTWDLIRQWFLCRYTIYSNFCRDHLPDWRRTHLS